jgi:flagellar hook-length control protein FliK
MSDVRRTPDASLGQHLLDASRRRERAKEHERSEDLWLATLTQTLVEQTPRLSLPPAEVRENTVSPASAQDGALAPAAAPGDADSPSDAGALASSRTSHAHGPPTAEGGPHDSSGLPSELRAEVSDERFGRLQLHVARVEGGLDIVINVADSHVKALIEAEQALLMKTLKDAGLHVASVQIGSTPRVGTPLALERAGAERTRAGASLSQTRAKRRTYQTSPEEDETASNGEGVDFTA